MSTGLYSGASGLALGVGLYAGNPGLWGGASGLITGDGSSLYLDFLAGAPLDSRITFTRGTNATLVDSTGKIVYAPANLLTYSEGTVAQMYSSSGVTDAGTTISGFANTITFGDNSVLRYAYKALAITAGTSYIASFFVQMDDNSAPTVGTGSSGGDFSIICDTGYAPTVTATLFSGNIYRVTGAITSATGGTTRNVGIIKNTGQSSKGFRVTGYQLEPVTYQTTPATYVATTTSAYYGPRFDYDPVTLAAKGLLIEEARTNLVTYSEQFDNAAWLKLAGGTASLPVVTANAGVAPDGTTTADRVVLNRGAGTTIADLSRLFQNTGIVATLGTLSVYMRSFDGVSTYTVRLFNGSAETNVTVTPSWQRFTLVSTNTTTNAQIAVRGDVNQQTADILTWAGQMEAGAFATSYIPTVASQVTRSADNAVMTGTNFSSWYNQTQGTFVVNADSALALFSGPRIIEVSSGTSARVVDLSVSTGPSLQMYNGTTSFNASGSVTLNVPFKGASAYKTANYGVVLNGGAATANTDALVNTANAMQIGRFNTSSNYLNGHIRSIAYYNTRLPNATLQALTA